MATPIATYGEKQTLFNERQAKAIDGIIADFKVQADLIEQLQNNPGPISAEDQALLDKLQTASEALTAKLESLDAAIPPALPPEVLER